MHISEREQQFPDQEIEKLIALLSERPSVLSLGAGEPDFHAPRPLVEYTKKIADKVNHYAPAGGFLWLREAICKKLKKENRIDARPDNVVVTCGSQEAILLASACALDVSEQVLIPNPSFMAYLPTIELFNASPVFFDLTEENNFEPDPDEIKKNIDPKKTKVLILNTPANPTGNVIRKNVLEEVADIAVEYDLLVFSDEAYEKITYDDAKHISFGSLNGMEKHAVTFHTFSKTYAMCGYRLGYAVAPPKMAEAIKKTHVYTTLAAPTISQYLGAKALTLPKRYTQMMVNEYGKRRKFIIPRLNEMGLLTPMPKGAFYAFSNIRHFSSDSRKFALQLLQKANVAVVPGTDFGTNGEGYIRFSFATEMKKIELAMERIEKFLRK